LENVKLLAVHEEQCTGDLFVIRATNSGFCTLGVFYELQKEIHLAIKTIISFLLHLK